jgi:hypothetical protein
MKVSYKYHKNNKKTRKLLLQDTDTDLASQPLKWFDKRR